MTKQNTTFLATALLASLVVASPVYADEKKDEVGLINVTGVGTVKTAPDMATINLTVLREAETAKEALHDNTRAMSDVLTAMRQFGIEDKDLQTSNFSINPRYIYPKHKDGIQQAPKIVGYQVSNSLTVRILDLDKVGEILDQSITLGVNQGGNIIFGNSDIAELQMQARAMAMKNALRKAEVLTKAVGVDIGNIKQINENSFHAEPQPIMRAEMAMAKMADSAPVPIAGGENAYRITVNVTFEIEQ
ncbi:SIMPL domain-containing protein [Lentilitoribacter sp. Alg239-R112]|uniref:SIMPL domain-containing protein n=1 Tax=Lentilitoribacter sp. Alg239-R112 TaxID=2305987 RepID=UPI0013A6A0B8|nr:SIMPL domain-containing protein [Lentilitoribacter sp. Alg239-R112]